MEVKEEMRRALYSAVLASAATALGSLVAAPIQACSLDGKPSAYANGVPAVVVHTVPTVKTYVWWAHFAFPRAFRAGQHIRLNEDDAVIRKLLPVPALQRPWRWRFGDGDMEIGDRVTHVYRRPGRYKLFVEAYFPCATPTSDPHTCGWEAFDTITVTARR